MIYIYEYIYLLIYIFIKEKEGLSLAGWPFAPSSFGEREHALSFGTESGCRREELINP